MAKRKVSKRPRGRRPARRRRQPPARAVEAALAGIAHDIRTPLTGMVALAELLASSDLNTREREWANAIKSGADHLAALTGLIVDAVRADAAKLVLRNEPFSPRALAEAVAAALQARAGTKQVQAEIAIASDLPDLVSGDALRLRAALENLADNAMKFTEHGSVRFAAQAAPAARGHVRLQFSVADSGIGMTAAELKQLFRPFAQASEEDRRKSQRSDGMASATRSLSILCAEDNPYGRVVMNTILRELGHRVDFVETGSAAVAAAERGGYDAILMDVALPGLDGIAATRRIRA